MNSILLLPILYVSKALCCQPVCLCMLTCVPVEAFPDQLVFHVFDDCAFLMFVQKLVE